jgi:hypothetical protein
LALEPLEVGGMQVQAPVVITTSLFAAGHDPARHSDPHGFDIERTDTSHLDFSGGAHYVSAAQRDGWPRKPAGGVNHQRRVENWGIRVSGEPCYRRFAAPFPPARGTRHTVISPETASRLSRALSACSVA